MSAAPSPTHPFAAYQHLLCARLMALIAPLPPSLQADVRTALTGESKLLSPTQDEIPSGVWSLLTFLLAHSLAPERAPHIVSSAAIALECYVCAIDLLDDVMDEDRTQTLLDLGVPRALSASDALRALAYQALLACHSPQNTELPLRLIETLTESSLRVARGQTEDVLAEDRDVATMSLEECIEIAKAKAGSIMHLACRLATECSNVSHDLSERFSQMGELLGIAHQLDNDAHDLYDLLYPKPGHTTSAKSDLLRRKKTLPVVLASQQSTFEVGTPLTDERYRTVLYSSIVQTWGMSYLYRNRARALFEQTSSEMQTDSARLLRLLLHF